MAMKTIAAAAALCAFDALAGAPSLRIAKWRNDAMGAVSLYYDDGCGSGYDFARPVLIQRSIPGTFYICCGWFKGADDPALLRWGAAARENKDVVFLGDHTWGHGGTTNLIQFAEEVAKNGALLRALAGLSPKSLLSYARPGGVKWEIDDEGERAVLAEHGEIKRHDFGGWIGGPHPRFIDSVGQMLPALDEAETNRSWQAILFHGVGGDWISFPASEHEKLVEEIDRRRSDGRIWPGAAIEVAKYETERDCAVLSPASCPDGALVAAVLEFRSDASLYDIPLTVVAENIPKDRGFVSVRLASGGAETRINAPVALGRAIFDVPPGAGSVGIVVE